MYCSKCGNKIDDDARFCDKCGFSLDGESEVQMPSTAGGIGHNPMLPLFIGICVAAVAVSAVIIMLILKPFGENDRRNRHDMNESVETVVENTEVLIREGDYIVFGRYEQDGDLSNGPEPIEWEIVAEENGRMLLISRYILDCQPYNTELEDVTWETCSLRAWLNDYFYNTAFNSVEQNRILSVTLSNPDNAYYGTEGGNDTVDKGFCLSFDEVLNNYEFSVWYEDDQYGQVNEFDRVDSLMANVSQYAVDQGVRGIDDYDEWGDWWLRTPGNSGYTVCYVNNRTYTTGSYYYTFTGWSYFRGLFTHGTGVRPALYVSVE